MRQGGARQLAAIEQELADHPTGQGHHHIVDLDPEVVLDLLDAIEVEPGEGDFATRGEPAVEHGARGGERRGHRAARAARRMVSTTALTVRGQELDDQVQRPAREASQAADCDLSGSASGVASTGSGGRRVGFHAA